MGKICTMCKIEKDESLFGAYSAKKDGLRPQCKQCMREMTSSYRKTEEGARKHREAEARAYPKRAEKMKERSRNWYNENRERASSQKREKYYENRESPIFVEKERERARNFYKNSPWIRAEQASRRRLGRRLATPKWLTKEDFDAMRAIYRECAKITKETGIKHNVDHYFPLKGKNFSGLHTPSNLRIITAEENFKKGNKAPDDPIFKGIAM